MQSYHQSSSFPRWSELLHRAVTEPGVISQAFSRFHNYSLGNQLLALQQCQLRHIEPGPIATFPRWKELGRYVRKGEKAITLCMPITVKATKATEPPPEADNVPAKDEEYILTRFAYKAHWFVLAQTDGAEYKPEPVPGWNEERALVALDIRRVTFGMPDGNLQGYFSEHRHGRVQSHVPAVAAHPGVGGGIRAGTNPGACPGRHQERETEGDQVRPPTYRL